MIGKTLGHYRIVEKIGAGGMGEVYRAHDEQLDRDVALKILPAASFRDPGAHARLLREARSAASLNHPHICTIYEVGEAEGQGYIAMELVAGQPLSVPLAGGPFPADQVLRYGLPLRTTKRNRVVNLRKTTRGSRVHVDVAGLDAETKKSLGTEPKERCFS